MPENEIDGEASEKLELIDLSRRLEDSQVSGQSTGAAETPDEPVTFEPVALETMATSGHWWTYFDVDPPDWYPYADTEVHGYDDLEEQHQPDIPDDVEWSAYIEYKCRQIECQDTCINRVDSRYAQAKICRACYPTVDVAELPSNTAHLPEEARKDLQVSDD